MSTTYLPVSALGDPVDPALQSFLRSTYAPNEPGAAIIVVVDGEVLHREAYGMADLELHVSLKPEMVFQIGSMTKQFTAAAILILEQQGELSRTDPITRHLPDYPDHGESITIEHLLTHTSGLYEFTTGRDLTSVQVRKRPDRTEVATAIAERVLGDIGK